MLESPNVIRLSGGLKIRWQAELAILGVIRLTGGLKIDFIELIILNSVIHLTGGLKKPPVGEGS
ncbi:hypothetical protein ACJO1P_03230 [Vibrio parahaemolyticus]|uniref:hypothetical protein n=1 Tax=Vibrio parahaemolyticus TaxID=670 RepID=UPI00387B5B6D